jgi:hypothetical protein
VALTQMQQIQSLGEALAWLEREIGWGVKPAVLGHLCGRIGELYACVMTNGQMALQVNQHGYDVRAASGERVSVKTTTQRLPCQINFNGNTVSRVDRVMVLRISTEEMQVEILVDAPIERAREMLRDRPGGKLTMYVAASAPVDGPSTPISKVRSATFQGVTVVELESGTVQVWSFGKAVMPVRPALRGLAAQIGVSVTNSRGNQYNTRRLGSLVLDRPGTRAGHGRPPGDSDRRSNLMPTAWPVPTRTIHS